MEWQVTFYSARVKNDILSWPVGISAKFTHIVELLRRRTHPMDLGMPFIKAMGHGLYEIRAQGSEGNGRAFFATITGKELVILHALLKKTQKTPTKDIEIAMKRLKEIKSLP